MNVRLSLDLPDEARTVPICRHVLRHLLRDLNVEPARADEIELAMSEAAGNVVSHAYALPGQRYQLIIDLFADRLRFQVIDQGCGFARDQVPAPDEEQLGGRGIWLIEQLADAATIRSLPGGGCQLDAEFRFHSLPLLAEPEPVPEPEPVSNGS
jgi:anti-sigma regulatory factor (Ser/Thr protein kinase)